MLGHQVHAVGLRRQRRDAERRPRRTVVAVVVVGADAPDPPDAEDELDAPGQRRLARCAVARRARAAPAAARRRWRRRAARSRAPGPTWGASLSRAGRAGGTRHATGPRGGRYAGFVSRGRNGRWQTTRSDGTNSPHRSPSTASGRRPPRAPAIRPRRCRARISSPSCSPIISGSTSEDPAYQGERSLHHVERSCGTGSVRRPEGRGRVRRRDAPVPAEGGLAAAGASRAAQRAPLGRRRVGLPRAGPRGRARHGAGDADRRHRRQRVGHARRLRDGRGLGLGSDGGHLLPRGRQA